MRPRKQERNINLARGDIFESLGKTKKLSAPSRVKEQQKFPARTSWEFEASFLCSAETDFGSVGQSEECHHVISDSQPRLLRGGCGEQGSVAEIQLDLRRFVLRLPIQFRSWPTVSALRCVPLCKVAGFNFSSVYSWGKGKILLRERERPHWLR